MVPASATLPVRSALEAEEAAVIFGISDQHQRVTAGQAGFGDRLEHPLHQRAADAFLLPIGSTATGPTITSGIDSPDIAGERDRPALDAPRQRAILAHRSEAQLGNRARARSDAIRGAAAPVGPERAVEQRLDSLRIDLGERQQCEHFVHSHITPGMDAGGRGL